VQVRISDLENTQHRTTNWHIAKFGKNPLDVGGKRGRGDGGRKEKVAMVIMCDSEWNYDK
jgi:hypothetical protein